MEKTKEFDKINVTITGTRPLLMHAIPPDFGEKKNTRGAVPIPKEEAEKSLYKDKNGIIAIPSLNILSTLRKAATDYKIPGKARKTFRDLIFSGIQIIPPYIPLSCNGTNPDKAWVIDLQPVNIQRAKIIRARPRFDEWSLNFQIEITDSLIQLKVLQDILESAGRFIGLCDYRPLFGLFKVDKFEKV